MLYIYERIHTPKLGMYPTIYGLMTTCKNPAITPERKSLKETILRITS